MANNFKVWDEGKVNIVSESTFANAEQFQNGTPASSSMVNSALREATLIAKALMAAVEENGANIDSLYFNSDLSAVVTAIKAGFSKLYRHNILLMFQESTTSSIATHLRFSVISSESDISWLPNGRVTSVSDAATARQYLNNLKTLILKTSLKTGENYTEYTNVGGQLAVSAFGKTNESTPRIVYEFGFLGDDMMITYVDGTRITINVSSGSPYIGLLSDSVIAL